jgi:uncharacterized protein YndB with AHSA1/START domain
VEWRRRWSVLTYGSSVVINKPVEAIFPYVVDPKLQALWSDVPMTRLDGKTGQFEPGSRIQLSFGMGPMKARIGVEIVAVEPGQRMAWNTFSGPIKWVGEYRLEADAAGTGTVVSQEGTLTFTGLWRAMEPMAGAEIRRGEEKELERLKALVEQE